MMDSRRIVARLAVAVMAADGKISRSELETVSHLRDLGLGDLSPYVRDELEHATTEPIDPDQTAAELGTISPDVGAIVVAALAEIATVDGVLAQNELRVLRIIGRRLGLDEREVDHLVHASVAEHGARVEGASPATEAAGEAAASAPAPAPVQAAPKTTGAEEARAAAARILGVLPEDSRPNIEAAYRRAVELYDPLRVVDLGPEFAVLAVRRLQMATDAFQVLLSAT